MDDGRAKFGLRDCATDDEAGSDNESDSLEEFSDSEDSYEEEGRQGGKVVKGPAEQKKAQIARELSWGARDEGDLLTDDDDDDDEQACEETLRNAVKGLGMVKILEKPQGGGEGISEGDDDNSDVGFRVGVGGLRADSMDGGGLQKESGGAGMVRRRRRTESWADMTDGDDDEEEEKDGIIDQWASRDMLVDQESENEEGGVRKVKADISMKSGQPYNVPTSGTFYLHDDRWEEQPARGRYHCACALWYKLIVR